MFTTLCFNRWVLGSTLCFINGVIGHIPLGFEAILLAVISLHRLYIVTHPKRSNISPLKAKVLLTCVWLFCFVYIIPVVALESVVYVNPHKLKCDFTIVKYRESYVISRTVLMLLLLGTILSTNIIMFFIATKQASTITGSSVPRRSAVVTTSCICWAYLLSYMPFMLREVIWATNIQPGWYGIFYSYMLTINSIVNPIIYTITNVRFRNYMLKIFLLKNNVVRVHMRRLTQQDWY